MVQRVKGFPAEFEELVLRDMEALCEGSIHVPEAGRTNPRQSRAGVAVPPPAVIVDVRAGPEGFIRAVNRLEGGGVNPLRDPLLLGAASAETGVTDQVRPARNRVARPADGEWHAALGVEIACQQPATDDFVERPFPIQEMPATA